MSVNFNFSILTEKPLAVKEKLGPGTPSSFVEGAMLKGCSNEFSSSG